MINPLDLHPLAMRLYAQEQRDHQINQVCTAYYKVKNGSVANPPEGWSHGRWHAALKFWIREVEDTK